MAEVAAPSSRDTTTQALKVPPHSIEAEQSILGGLMLDNNAWEVVADRVTEEDFYRRDHRLVFRAITALAAQGKPFDAVTVSEYLSSINELENAGGLGYFGDMVQNTPVQYPGLRRYCSQPLDPAPSDCGGRRDQQCRVPSGGTPKRGGAGFCREARFRDRRTEQPRTPQLSEHQGSVSRRCRSD